MFAISIKRDGKSCSTVGEMIDFLGKYPRETPVLTGFDDEVEVSKQVNKEDESEFFIYVDASDGDDW